MLRIYVDGLSSRFCLIWQYFTNFQFHPDIDLKNLCISPDSIVVKFGKSSMANQQNTAKASIKAELTNLIAQRKKIEAEISECSERLTARGTPASNLHTPLIDTEVSTFHLPLAPTPWRTESKLITLRDSAYKKCSYVPIAGVSKT